MRHNQEILIIGSKNSLFHAISEFIRNIGYKVHATLNKTHAINYIVRETPILVILNINTDKHEADLSLLKQIRTDHHETVVVAVTENSRDMIKAIKLGAYDCIDGPFGKYRLQIIIARAIESANYKFSLLPYQELTLVGKSSIIRKLNTQIKNLAGKSSRVLITGAPGTGKEIIAKILHNQSKNPTSPFIVLNSRSCFTQLSKLHNCGLGLSCEQNYNTGTLYIDGITEFSLEKQMQILLLLEQQQKNIREYGMNFRIISSSVQSPEQAVRLGKMREDLYNRLNVASIKVPTLSERIEDIQELCEYFINYLSRTSGLSKKPITQDDISAMQTYSWPGNIRQLKNVIELILITPDTSNLEHILLSDKISSTINKNIIATPLKEAKRIFEREYLQMQVNRFGGNISKTAKFICMERAALHRRLKTLGMT